MGSGNSDLVNHATKRDSSGHLAPGSPSPLTRNAGLLAGRELTRSVMPSCYSSNSFVSSCTSTLWSGGTSREVLSALSTVKSPSVPSLGQPAPNLATAPAVIRPSSALDTARLLSAPLHSSYFCAASGSHGDLHPELPFQRSTLPSAPQLPFRPLPSRTMPTVDFTLRVPADFQHLKGIAATSAFVTPQSSRPHASAGDSALQGAMRLDFAGCPRPLPVLPATPSSVIRTWATSDCWRQFQQMCWRFEPIL
jgi:hypothetical protein